VDAAGFAPFDLATLFDSAPYSRPLRRRLAKAALALRDKPQASLPTALGPAGYRALTRLWQNPRVHERLPFDEVFAASAARLPPERDVVVAHDTTDFIFHAEGERHGLERVDDERVRFRGHVSLAVLAEGERVVAGVLAFEPIARTAPVAAGQSAKARYDAPDKESLRWGRGIAAAEARAAGRARLIHVMDREADDYAQLCTLTERRWRFVQRLRQSRVLAEAPPYAPAARKVDQALAAVPVVLCEREVPLSRRKGFGARRPEPVRKRFPARAARVARLEVRAASLSLARPKNAPDALPASLELTVVHVREPAPPEGETAVEWVLYTSEPASTAAEALRVVDLYRRRWVVEVAQTQPRKTSCASHSGVASSGCIDRCGRAA
jgi:Transposase DDE domain